MTRDQILYVAQNHWLYDLANPREELAGWLVEFANVIAAHERDACAKLCHDYAQQALNNASQNAAMELRDAIRARGKS